MNILLTGFRNTSSELLVKTANDKSLILPNDKIADAQILLEEMERQRYDYIFSFGQKPNIKNKIYFETTAQSEGRSIITNYDYGKLKSTLESYNIPVLISSNAGTSFCNMLYWHGLNYIYDKCLDTKMIFLHIPYSKNITNSETFFKRILEATSSL